MTNFRNIDFAKQCPRFIQHRQKARMALADGIDELSQGHVGTDRRKLSVDDAVQTHQSQHGLIRMMG